MSISRRWLAAIGTLCLVVGTAVGFVQDGGARWSIPVALGLACLVDAVWGHGAGRRRAPGRHRRAA